MQHARSAFPACSSKQPHVHIALAAGSVVPSVIQVFCSRECRINSFGSFALWIATVCHLFLAAHPYIAGVVREKVEQRSLGNYKVYSNDDENTRV